MDHQAAKNAKLVERYLLGEMADAERDAFEEHYFSCAECAEEVVTATKFVDNARRPLLALQETEKEKPREVPPAPWWDRWLALAPKPVLAGACAVLLAALVWQHVPGGVEAEVTGSYFVTATRVGGGAPRKIQALPGQKRVALLFNYTDTSVTQFTFQLQNADGHKVQQFGGRAPQDTNDIQVMVPVDGLRVGTYTLRVLNSSTQQEIAALPFELVFP